MAIPSKHDPLAAKLAHAKQLHREGHLDEARKQYEKLLGKDRGNVKLLSLLGGVLLQMKRYKEAVPHLRNAIIRNPKDADLSYNLGLAYYHLRDYASAVEAYGDATRKAPEHDRAWYMMGKAYMEWDDKTYRAEAFHAYQKDIEFTERVDSHVMLAEILFNEKRYEDARGVAKRALELDPTNEIALWTMAKTMIKENYKKAYMDVRHAEPIIKAGNLILQLYPKSWRGHHVLAEALSMIGEDKLALEHYQKLNALRPDFAGSRTSAAVLMLRQGRMKEGWEEISHRKEHGTALYGINTRDIDECPAPLWQGQMEAGKSMLIASEQGIGDQILHAQLLKELIDAGMKVHMTCTPKITQLMARSIPEVNFYPANTGVPQEIRDRVDYKADLLDLGKYLRDDMTKFQHHYYFLKPLPELVEHFRSKYQTLFDGKLKIGVSWKSSSKSIGELKSTELMQWRQILSVPGVQFINVQYGDVRQEVENFKTETGIDVYLDEFDPFDDIEKAVAQIAALDMVVSVSNAAVHFAGQLNVPCMVLLNQRTLWHWFEGNESTVWYESLRLYRQEQLETWEPVFERVAHDLRVVIDDYNAQQAGEQHD